MSKHLTINEKVFSRDEIELLDFLAQRRQLSFVIEQAIKGILHAKGSEELPLLKEAKAQLEQQHAATGGWRT